MTSAGSVSTFGITGGLEGEIAGIEVGNAGG